MTFYDHESPIFQGLFLGASPIWGVSWNGATPMSSLDLFSIETYGDMQILHFKNPPYGYRVVPPSYKML